MPSEIKIDRPLVLIGLMGAGKSTVGRRLATRLNWPFVDSDEEIEIAANCSIEDIFEIYGEHEFRALETRVIDRLLDESPKVIATGGGAFLNDQTRQRALDAGFVVWLKADLDVLVERTSRRGGRPLLKTKDPRDTLKKLIDRRYPTYAKAHVTIDTNHETLDSTVDRIQEAINAHFGTPL